MGIVREGDHGSDLWTLFNGGHKSTKSMMMESTIIPGQEEAIEKESQQLIKVVGAFMQTKVPQVEGQQWTPFPMSMALKPQPELQEFPDEFHAWEEIKSKMVRELQISVALPWVNHST